MNKKPQPELLDHLKRILPKARDHLLKASRHEGGCKRHGESRLKDVEIEVDPRTALTMPECFVLHLKARCGHGCVLNSIGAYSCDDGTFNPLVTARFR